MHLERAASDWTGVLFIVIIVVANLINAMRKGKPPEAPPERPKPQSKPQPRPQAQTPPPPVWRPAPVIPPFNPAPRPPSIPTSGADVSAQTKADPESGDLSGLLDRLRKLEAARQSE